MQGSVIVDPNNGYKRSVSPGTWLFTEPWCLEAYTIFGDQGITNRFIRSKGIGDILGCQINFRIFPQKLSQQL